MSNEKQQTGVDKLIEIYWNNEGVITLKNLEQAKEMEKKQAQQYAEFCVRCDRENLPLLDFESYILTYGGN
jgi:hypothetical protein